MMTVQMSVTLSPSISGLYVPVHMRLLFLFLGLLGRLALAR